MFRIKIIFLLVMALAILLSSCAPGAQNTLSPDLTLVPYTDIPQQATVTPDIFTPTLATVTSTPVLSVATAPPPIVEYNNSAVGYRLNLPGDWLIDETSSTSKEVIFSPPNPEPFITYLSIALDSRTLDQIINLYAQSVPDATREDTIFNGYPGIKYTYTYQNDVYRIEYYIPYGGRIFSITTDKPDEGIIQSILLTVRFTAPPQPITYEATMEDNGRTFVMNIGDKLRINLDLSYDWSAISISDPAIIAGAGDGYFAFASGTATLTTTGNPQCLNFTPPCGMPSIMFTITVIVQ